MSIDPLSFFLGAIVGAFALSVVQQYARYRAAKASWMRWML